MRRSIGWWAILLITAAIGCQKPATPVTYSVSVYDPARDAAADLAATTDAAEASHKRILLQVGGDWCGWCHRLDKFIASHSEVSQAIGENFIVMKVNKSDENENAEFLSQFPKVDGYPHWFVLESDGTLLHSQGTAELEDGKSYSASALLKFADAWKASSPGA